MFTSLLISSTSRTMKPRLVETKQHAVSTRGAGVASETLSRRCPCSIYIGTLKKKEKKMIAFRRKRVDKRLCKYW